MNNRIKKLWINALYTKRVGNNHFEQGHGCLAPTDTQRCCLGVLTEIAILEGVTTANDMVNKQMFLSEEVVKWAGLNSGNPVVEGPQSRTLASLNDSGTNRVTGNSPWTFQGIARAISKHL